MNAKEFLEQEDSTWVDVDDNNLIKSCMIGFAERYHEYRVKNCSIPAVVATEGQCCDSFRVRNNYKENQTCEKCGQFPWEHD